MKVDCKLTCFHSGWIKSLTKVILKIVSGNRTTFFFFDVCRISVERDAMWKYPFSHTRTPLTTITSPSTMITLVLAQSDPGCPGNHKKRRARFRPLACANLYLFLRYCLTMRLLLLRYSSSCTTLNSFVILRCLSFW